MSERPFFEISRILFEYTANCQELCTVINDEAMRIRFVVIAALALYAAASCEILDNDPDKHAVEKNDSTYVGLEEVAQVLSLIPLKCDQLAEVHSAVTSSSGNGYDEEYTMKDLFRAPGAGVGDRDVKSGTVYENPLRELIEEQVRSLCNTKTETWAWSDPDKFLKALMESDVQIYWPFSEEWDGSDMPVITFDPEDGSEVNVGYRFRDDDGFRRVEEVIVDEEMARSEPVWVVNRNSDAGFKTLEMLRREDPDWGEGGGNIVVRPEKAADTRSEESLKTLILKDFVMKRNYDPWFAGASEFFVKIGYMEDFTATTEAELRLYDPLVTDFMIVVRRSQVGIPQNFNAVLMSDWSDDADGCALMITEDDGGTRTEWTTKAKVFVAGKSYGVEISIPLNSRDDVVWRGSLAYRWLEKYNGETWPFGDVDLTFEVIGF